MGWLEQGSNLEQFFERLQAVIPASTPLFLVGGAVRDRLIARPIQDMDFVLGEKTAPGRMMALGRRVANALQGAFYPLDEARDTARVLLALPEGDRLVLDFAALRGDSLEADLLRRDFTLNAMAIPIADLDKLIDPLNGLEDLRLGVLRPCAPTAFQDDPLRIVRGVRLAAQFNFRLLPETLAAMRGAQEGLRQVSAERVRDEAIKSWAAQNRLSPWKF